LKELIARIRGWLFILRCRYLRKEIQFGEGLRIYKKLTITGTGKVTIGKNCSVRGIPGDKSQYVTIDTHDRNAIVSIGDNACLCAARISSRFSITIGSNVLIEESGIADTDFHSIDKDRVAPLGETLEGCKIVIGDRVRIGVRSFIAKGVYIGEDALIGPCSIVTRSINAGSFVLGNPARESTRFREPK
jgi:acetyltransferase-like isoleucine patch superfamily enzyme